MTSVRIGVVGCAGRMGHALIQQIGQTRAAEFAGGTEAPGHEAVGKDPAVLAGLDPSGLEIGDDPAALFAESDAVLDFTAPDASVSHAELAARTNSVLVIGTTGLEPAHLQSIEKAGDAAVIVQAANMSLGVNLLIGLTRQVAGLLDDEYDIEIVEMHHRYKKDAPSGTALALGEAAAEGRDVDFAKTADRGRDGMTGGRKRGAIGLAALRGGNVVGEHSVIFAADDERVELTHKAGDRAIFARGAVHAALWGQGKPPGLYGMKDVLGL